MTFLKPALKLLLVGMKVQLDKGDRRILLSDNTGDGAVTMWPTAFQRVGVSLSTGLPYTVFTHTQDNSYLRQPHKKSVCKGKMYLSKFKTTPQK